VKLEGEAGRESRRKHYESTVGGGEAVDEWLSIWLTFCRSQWPNGRFDLLAMLDGSSKE